jgi:hypothetical protein
MVLFCYPGGAGGKFLINCLGLNENAVFQHKLLVEQQLRGKFSQKDKIKYLYAKLDLAEKNQKWVDLDLGCDALYGFNSFLYHTDYQEELQYKFYPIVNKIIDNKYYTFLVCHSTNLIETYLKHWPQAKIVFFTEYREFLDFRYSSVGPQLIKWWNNVRYPDWPALPPTTAEEFELLPKHIQDIICNEYDNEISLWFDRRPLVDQLYSENSQRIAKSIESNRTYFWSVKQGYADSSQLIDNYKKISQWLQIENTVADSDLIDYFNRWKQVIQGLKFSINLPH